jgi:hypothetical protein
MKNIKIFICFFVASIGILSCNKNDFNYPAGKVGISTVVYFPSISLNGSSTLVITAGSTFADPGVVATVNGQAVTPTITGSVNANTPGIYWLTYTAKNQQGFTSSVSRIVIVKSASPAAPDYSGNWKRNAGAFGISQWIQLTPTTYAVSDPGGANYTNFWCVVTLSGSVPQILSQNVPQTLGGTSTSISTISSGAISGTTAGSTYTWAINTSGFGTGNRTFVKQ